MKAYTGEWDAVFHDPAEGYWITILDGRVVDIRMNDLPTPYLFTEEWTAVYGG